MKIIADKISSSTRNVKIIKDLTLTDDIVCKEGFVVAGRVLSENKSYNALELVSGRMSRICVGDIIVGVLGKRNALKGFSGIVPESLHVGDKLQILNMGGVLGKCTSESPEFGRAVDVEILGAVLHFPSFVERIGKQASIHQGTVEPRDRLQTSPPLVIVTGTCMNAGKTRAASEIIKFLSQRGKRVGAGKLSGISLMRDTLEMIDYGAERALNFTDVGVVCSTPENVVPSAKGIVDSLAKDNFDCIVFEFGDGIMGEYGVMALLEDKELMSYVKAHILSANDPVAAWGAAQFLKGKCPEIDVVCGPTTDNEVGKKFIRDRLGIKAANAMRDSESLGNIVYAKLFPEEAVNG